MDDGENHPLAEELGYGANLKGTGEPKRQWAQFRVSFEMLKLLLKLPAHANILATMDDRETGSVLIRVESPEFSPVQDGFVVPTVYPRYHCDEIIVGGHTTIRTITFVGWE